MRERLIKFIKNSLMKHIDKSCLLAENIADDLLADGVIVPPCKVGDTLFVVGSCIDLFFVKRSPCPYEDVCRVDYCDGSVGICEESVFPVTVERIDIGDHDIYSVYFEQSDYEYLSTDIGKKVFLTREEAESALKGR